MILPIPPPSAGVKPGDERSGIPFTPRLPKGGLLGYREPNFDETTFFAERWLSGRRHRIANPAYAYLCTEGSNPFLSATFPLSIRADLLCEYFF